MPVRLFLCALTLSLLALPARAEEAKQAEKPPAVGADPLEALATAHSLAAYGRANKMPEALVTAALIIARAGNGGASDIKIPDENKSDAPVKDEAVALIAEAKELAETPAQKLLVKEAEADLKGAKRGTSPGYAQDAFKIAGTPLTLQAPLTYAVDNKITVQAGLVGSGKNVVRPPSLFKITVIDKTGKVLGTATGATPLVTLPGITAPKTPSGIKPIQVVVKVKIENLTPPAKPGGPTPTLTALLRHSPVPFNSSAVTPGGKGKS